MSERRPDDPTDEDRSPGGGSTLPVLLALGADALQPVPRTDPDVRAAVLDRYGFQLADGATREGSARDR